MLEALLHSSYFWTGAGLALRELGGFAWGVVQARRVQAQDEAKLAAKERELDIEAADKAYSKLNAFVDTLQADVAAVRSEFEAERKAREAAERSLRGSHEEFSAFRLQLLQAGCPAMRCIVDGECRQMPAGAPMRLLAAPEP